MYLSFKEIRDNLKIVVNLQLKCAGYFDQGSPMDQTKVK